uniref:Uncharacterized protein n=1 Tax=Panagrellus redivivus TaxID=6233 RepID=A0A7E4ZYA6_PANRE
MPVYANNVVNIPENLGMYTRMTRPLRPPCERPTVLFVGAGYGSLKTLDLPTPAPSSPSSPSSSATSSLVSSPWNTHSSNSASSFTAPSSPSLSATSGSLFSLPSVSSATSSRASFSLEPHILPEQLNKRPSPSALNDPYGKHAPYPHRSYEYKTYTCDYDNNLFVQFCNTSTYWYKL